MNKGSTVFAQIIDFSPKFYSMRHQRMQEKSNIDHHNMVYIPKKSVWPSI